MPYYLVKLSSGQNSPINLNFICLILRSQTSKVNIVDTRFPQGSAHLNTFLYMWMWCWTFLAISFSWLLLLLLRAAPGDTASLRASAEPTSVKHFWVIYVKSLTTMGSRCSMIKGSREAKPSHLLLHKRLGNQESQSSCYRRTMLLQDGAWMSCWRLLSARKLWDK